MGFTLEHIDRALKGINRLLPAKPNRESAKEYSLKEGIFFMAPKLLEKKEMGCTTNELVTALGEEGIVIKGPTLNRYLCEYQKNNETQPGNINAMEIDEPDREDAGDVRSPVAKNSPALMIAESAILRDVQRRQSDEPEPVNDERI